MYNIERKYILCFLKSFLVIHEQIFCACAKNVLNMGTQIMMLFYVGVKRARQKAKTKNFKTDDEFR